MDTAAVKEEIHLEAMHLGFSKCGFASSRFLAEDFSRYETLIAENYHAEMLYLGKEPQKRFYPSLIHPEIRTVIVLMAGYKTQAQQGKDAGYIISKYALIPDYHIIMMDQVKKLSSFIDGKYHPKILLNFVDTGPISEKAWARQAGLGNFGKNSLIITPEGSYFFIGIILTDLLVDPDEPFYEDLCHDCDLCVKTCPTQALHKPYAVDARLCISYHTIENKKDIPASIVEKMGTKMYGCDVCQEVCPLNRRQAVNSVFFSPLSSLLDMRAKDFEAVGPTDFKQRFHESSMLRLGYRRYKRNIEAVKKMAASERKRPS